MKVAPVDLPGCLSIALERHVDDRGFFARSFSPEAFRAAGVTMSIVEANWSHNARRGTVRGMHFQAEPHGEPKIVSCVRGSIQDVFVDMRPSSPAYLRWTAIELTGESLNAVYLPPGIAHGFQTLTDDALVQYWMGAPYVPEAGRGIRYDDPKLGIEWPLPVSTVSTRDRSWALL